jgi:hypothetical protein
MIDKGDPYALKLQQEARSLVMPNINGTSKDRALALLGMLRCGPAYLLSHR